MKQQPKQPAIVVINAGSSSIKYGVYNADDMSLLEREKIEISDPAQYESSFKDIIDLFDEYDVRGVGHRVVHGGMKYKTAEKLDPEDVK